MKYQSLTTENIEHDSANMLAEFMWLNNDIRSGPFPWRGENGKKWSSFVSVFKKLMKEPYGLTAGQIAFYIWNCKPRHVNPREFAKMAVVARKLFTNMSIDEVSILYKDRIKELASSGMEKIKYKEDKPKSLLTFLRELENG